MSMFLSIVITRRWKYVRMNACKVIGWWEKTSPCELHDRFSFERDLLLSIVVAASVKQCVTWVLFDQMRLCIGTCCKKSEPTKQNQMHIADTIRIVMISQKEIMVDQIGRVLDTDDIDSNFAFFYTKHASACTNIEPSASCTAEDAFSSLLSRSCKTRLT